MHNCLESSPEDLFQIPLEAIIRFMSADTRMVLNCRWSGGLVFLADPNRKAVVKFKGNPKIRPCFEKPMEVNHERLLVLSD